MTADPRPAFLIAVVPHPQAARMAKRGWAPTGRSNGHTATLYRHFPDEADAHAVGHRLRCVWAVERAV